MVAGAGGAGGRPTVNAAPDVGGGDDEDDVEEGGYGIHPSLLGSSGPSSGAGAPAAATQQPKAKSGKDEYEEFMNQMKDLL